jgi:carboxyl-terminal processing protease
VQTILPVERYMPFFSDKSRAGALKVTIQKFYRIAGGSTQLRGVIPDVNLPSVHDVMEIGEDALPHALPYDTIPSRTFTFWSKNPLPSDQLRTRVSSRITKNPEFQYVLDDTKRRKERNERNSISLNEAARVKELEEEKARIEVRKQERKDRVKELADKSKDAFDLFRLTLDNVDQPQLVKESSLSREDTSGMRLAKNVSPDDDEPVSENSQFTYGIEPVKLETINILRDWIDISAHQPQTANTEGQGAKKSAGL